MHSILLALVVSQLPPALTFTDCAAWEAPATGLQRLAIADPAVADVEVAGGTLRLRPRGAGQTTLLAWNGATQTSTRVTVASGLQCAVAPRPQRDRVSPPAPSTIADVSLAIGEVRRLPLAGLSHFRFSEVVSARAAPGGGALEVKGRARGATCVVLQSDTDPTLHLYRVYVGPRSSDDEEPCRDPADWSDEDQAPRAGERAK